MNYVGVDLHKKVIMICVMDANRKVLRRVKLAACEPHRLVAFFEELGRSPGIVAACDVSDAALARCAAPEAGLDGAEHLWAALVRETPDPEAAEPAALLAACALLRGDGALAGGVSTIE